MKTVWIIAVLGALSIAGCGPSAPPPATQAATAAASADCNRAVRTTIAFTAPDAQDIIEARSIGDTCKAAIVVISVRKATGEPLWAWATPTPWLAGADPDAPGAMENFLAGWKPKVDSTAALPDWPERDIFKDSLGAFMSTPFERERYLELRGKALPRLCHATGVESGVCIYYDPSTGTAGEILKSGA